MFSLKERLLFWTKLGQAATPATPSATTTQTATVSSTPPPPPFNAVSGPWAWISQYYRPATVRYLSDVLRMAHIALHNTSYGQYNLVKNQNNLGSVDPSNVGTGLGISVTRIAQQLYKTFLNNGQRPAQQPNANQIGGWVDTAIRTIRGQSNLTQMDPITVNQLKLQGDYAQSMINLLNLIKNDYSTQPAEPGAQPGTQPR